MEPQDSSLIERRTLLAGVRTIVKVVPKSPCVIDKIVIEIGADGPTAEQADVTVLDGSCGPYTLMDRVTVGIEYGRSIVITPIPNVRFLIGGTVAVRLVLQAKRQCPIVVSVTRRK